MISAPIISLADPEKAVDEVEFVISRGAKLVCVRPGPVPGEARPRSLGDPVHDPVWARLAEAGVAVVFHLSDSGYMAIPGCGAAAVCSRDSVSATRWTW